MKYKSAFATAPITNLQSILTESQLKCLESMDIILASGSERRKEILKNFLGEDGFRVVPSQAEENLDKSHYNSQTLWKYATDTADLKCSDVNSKLKNGNKSRLVIGADTIVTLNKVIFEKPKTEDEAISTLSLLKGKTHRVFTGVSLIHYTSQNGEIKHQFCDQTDVTFDNYSDSDIREYVESGEPMDKAGSYGIQGKGCALVSKIEGDFYNVVGFPIYKFRDFLIKYILE